MAVETRLPFYGANGIAGRVGAGREGLRKDLPKGGVLDQQVSAQGDGVGGDGRQMRQFFFRRPIVADENGIDTQR